jgi:hypothetical protein
MARRLAAGCGSEQVDVGASIRMLTNGSGSQFAADVPIYFCGSQRRKRAERLSDNKIRGVGDELSVIGRSRKSILSTRIGLDVPSSNGVLNIGRCMSVALLV